MSRRTFIALSALVITIFVSVGFLFSTGVWQSPFKEQATEKNLQEGPTMTAFDANELATQKAKEWRSDAVLSQVSSLEKIGQKNGGSNDWQMIFTSSNASGTALEIIIKDEKISSSSEIPFYGTGGKIPQNALTSEEAVKIFREMKGFENEPIISIEIIYGEKKGEWYWGIKTNKGVVTIRADR